MTTTLDSITRELLALTPGHTRVIFGVVVTRWGADTFELRTWGGDCLDTVQAAIAIGRRQ